jgi:hypothetical protein
VREKGRGVKVCERQTYRSVQRLQPKSISRAANCMSWFTMDAQVRGKRGQSIRESIAHARRRRHTQDSRVSRTRTWD